MLAHPISNWEMMAMAFSTNAGAGPNGLSSEINVTPLIDVLLVMLIIFMMIVPVMQHGFNSAIPDSGRTSGADSAAGPVLVRVERGEAAERYFVDGVGVEKAEVGPRLVEALARSTTRQMLVRADAELDYGVVAGVIDAGQAAGAVGIGLVTPGTERFLKWTLCGEIFATAANDSPVPRGSVPVERVV
jgi:biopolymer transport protein TolR